MCLTFLPALLLKGSVSHFLPLTDISKTDYSEFETEIYCRSTNCTLQLINVTERLLGRFCGKEREFVVILKSKCDCAMHSIF